MAVVTIIGSGMMGSALAFPARENGHEVRLVGTHLDREIIEVSKATNRHPKFVRDFPEGLKFYQIEQVQEAIEGSDLIIGGVSSFGVEWFGDEILPIIPEHIPVITVTKGLIDTPEGKLITYPAYWQQKLSAMGKKLNLNAIGGPCTSYELVAHDQTEVAFCGNDMKTLEWIRGIMTTDYYHISLSTDVVGIESAVALKNGYALGIALTIGLNQKEFGINSELHFNSQAAIFGQAVKEMYKLLDYQGAATLENMTVGYGDLYVTVYGGRTRLVGILLGRGLNIDEAKEELNGVTLESLVVAERVARAIKTAAARGVLDAKDFPLLLHVDEIICQKKEVCIPWEAFTFRTNESGASYWKQSPKNVYVAAHRGWSAIYPENTMIAFEKAIEVGVDQIETDVRVTKDGELVLIHDKAVDRTTNGTGLVKDYTYAELQQLDAGSWKGEEFAGTRIPKFVELMELVKDHPTMTLDVELKEYPVDEWEETAYDVCDRVMKIIDDYGYTNRVVINTWSAKLNEYIAEKYGTKYRQHLYFPPRVMGEAVKEPYSYGYCVCMFSQEGGGIATAEECAEMRKKGLRTWAGAFVKDEETVDRAIACDSELITTNYPDVVLGILRRKNRHA